MTPEEKTQRLVEEVTALVRALAPFAHAGKILQTVQTQQFIYDIWNRDGVKITTQDLLNAHAAFQLIITNEKNERQ